MVKAIDHTDISVERGEFVAVVGRSGSGKSTLLHMLGGLDRPTSGKVMIEQKDISSMDKDELTIFRRRKIGFVFQNYNLLPLMNVYENIVLPIKLDGIRPQKRYVNEIIEMLGLGDKKSAMPSQLSGGQQQRVLIARALCATTQLLILDEPITGLDPTAIQEFYAMLRRLNREDGVAILMVSHDLRNAVEEANKILHLQKRVMFYGPAHDYMNSKAAGHFFHEKEQGRCKPTAGCHVPKLHMHTADGKEERQ